MNGSECENRAVELVFLEFKILVFTSIGWKPRPQILHVPTDENGRFWLK